MIRNRDLSRPLPGVTIEVVLIIWMQVVFFLFQLDEFLDGFGEIGRFEIIF